MHCDVKDPAIDWQLQAVGKNYDAIKYIKDPHESVQELAVKINYDALRYMSAPDRKSVV